ncbi:MAG TPA: carbon-nitrogen hydrolase family protein [Chthoniobacteraceae bacterium]|nr:carbon-nitrogen hydrolase family protein [Chthoniobacteraceae bacterium]
MARNITISSVGGSPALYPGPVGDEKLVERMIAHWRRKIEAVLPDRPDLIVLPECSARYRHDGTLAREEVMRLRPILGEAMETFLRQLAAAHRCHIVYPSVFPAEESQGLWYNGARVIDRNGGVIGQYNKNYTVVTERGTGIVCGESPALVSCDFGTLAPLICFDLNFVELIDAYRALRPDLLIFPSMYHGGFLQPYWAYQCRAHFVGCMGQEPLRSEIYAPSGALLASSTNYFSHVTARVNLDCALVHLDFHWEKLRALKEKYGPAVQIADPAQVGAVLVSCESEEQCVGDLLKEFEIESLDDYFDRSRAHRRDRRNRHPGASA